MFLEIDGGYSGIRFSACHFIPKHEKCSRLHGHSYTVHLRLDGEIGEDGMVMDFVILKKKLKEIIDEMDHKVLLPTMSKDVELIVIGSSVEVVSYEKKYIFPLEDTKLLDIHSTTAEEICNMINMLIIEEMDFPSNIKSVSIGLDEERGQTIWSTKVVS